MASILKQWFDFMFFKSPFSLVEYKMLIIPLWYNALQKHTSSLFFVESSSQALARITEFVREIKNVLFSLLEDVAKLTVCLIITSQADYSANSLKILFYLKK